MIMIKLQGGLGNQLFQYAAGRSLAHITNQELKLDVTSYGEDKKRTYALSVFDITGEIATKEEVEHFKKFQRKDWGKIKGVLGKIKAILHNKFVANKRKYFIEKQFHFDPDVLGLTGDSYIEGFFNTEKYFRNVADIIKKEFSLKIPVTEQTKILSGTINSCNSVSMHIRRGDYASDPANLSYFGLCSVEYYKEAANIIASKISDPHLFIFSDDHAWVKENINLNFPTTYVDHTNGNTAYEDLLLMSLCKHNIIANSTFSWWGAWLNKNKNKIVIAPQKWFNQTKSNTFTHDVLPEEWIKI